MSGDFEPPIPPDAVEANKRLAADMQSLIRDTIRKHHLQCESLTEDQLVSVIQQAIASGDLMRHVRVDTHRQAVTYVPYREVEALREKLRNIEALVRSEWRHAGDRLNELFRSVDPL